MLARLAEAATVIDDRDAGDELVLRCRVGEFELALQVADVVEVHRAVAVRPLPGAPDVVAGVVDVRGDLVPVLDLRRRLGAAARPVTPSDVLVMVAIPERQLLLLCDEAQGVEAVPGARIREAAELVPGGRYLAAVAGTPTGPLVISDLASFLSSDERLDLESALADLEVAAGVGSP